MALLNTAWLGDLSPPLPLLVSHTNMSWYISFSLSHAVILPSFLHAFRSHCLSVNCVVYSLIIHSHTHHRPVFKLYLSVSQTECVCVCECVCVAPSSPFSQQRPQLLPVC